MARGGYVGVNSTFYTPVDYLQSSGTQYIDTMIHPNANIKCIVDFQYVSVANSGIIGGWDGSKGMLFGVNNSKFQFAFGTSAWAGNTINADTNRHTVYMNDENGDGRLDDTVLASHSNVVSLVNDVKQIYLFRSNGGAGLSSSKIYSCKIYDSSTLIRDFIPVLDRNNVACMYDKVNNRFYYNQGTGTFSYGAAVTPTPSDIARNIKQINVGIKDTYTPVEYIESSGLQYFDTGYKANNNTKIEFCCSLNYNVSGQFLFGTRDYSNQTYQKGYVVLQNGGNNWRSDYSSNGSTFTYTTSTNTVYTIVKDKNITYINGTSVYTNTATTFTMNNTVKFFCVENEVGINPYIAAVKLYYCKIWDNDTLVRDFIPVKDKGGIACLYDKVDGRVYLNQGSGRLLAGNEVSGETPIQETTGKSRDIVKVYAGVNGVARKSWSKYFYQSLNSFNREINSLNEPLVTNTADYILIGGGYSTNNNTCYSGVNAYDINHIQTSCTSLPVTVRRGMTMTCAGYGIMTGGNYNSNQGNLRNNCTAYDNNLTRTTMSNITTGVYNAPSVRKCNTLHFRVRF